MAADENMLARQTFAAIPLTVGDKLTVEWDITIGGPQTPTDLERFSLSFFLFIS